MDNSKEIEETMNALINVPDANEKIGKLNEARQNIKNAAVLFKDIKQQKIANLLEEIAGKI